LRHFSPLRLYPASIHTFEWWRPMRTPKLGVIPAHFIGLCRVQPMGDAGRSVIQEV